jgi:hypothetical protein
MHLAKVAVILALLVAASGPHAQTAGSTMNHGAGHRTQMHHQGTVPTLPGQDAFAAIQEIVQMLQADPTTDWSRVNIDALREHLIDMNEVTLHAKAQAVPVEGGLRILVTGTGRTLQAIRRMVPAHAREINGLNGWSVKSSPAAGGIVLTATSSNPAEAVKIRGLGFAGIMVQGAHHQPHHLAMAKGTFRH